MIRLSSSRRFDMKSCLLHRVTKLAKLQLGPITVMKVVQQHNNSNSRRDKKRLQLWWLLVHNPGILFSLNHHQWGSIQQRETFPSQILLVQWENQFLAGLFFPSRTTKCGTPSTVLAGGGCLFIIPTIYTPFVVEKFPTISSQIFNRTVPVVNCRKHRAVLPWTASRALVFIISNSFSFGPTQNREDQCREQYCHAQLFSSLSCFCQSMAGPIFGHFSLLFEGLASFSGALHLGPSPLDLLSSSTRHTWKSKVL